MLKEIFQDVDSRMQQALDHLMHELAGVRTGRASLVIFDGVRVDYYGTPSPLNQVAKLGVPDASMITIQPYDPALIGDIERAIQAANLGLNPANDGKLIRVPIPPLTSERRQTLQKKVHALGEETKNGIRHVRRDGNDATKALEKDKEISEDEEHRAYDEIQKKTEVACGKVDEMVQHKVTELREA
jgi:ribosome recycling factor